MENNELVDLKWLAHQADVWNTITGGVIQPIFEKERLDKEYLIIGFVPGVSLEKLHVEIRNSRLVVFYNLLFTRKEEDEIIEFVVGSFPIPRSVNYDLISSEVIADELVIHLPKDPNRLTKREIPIDKK